MGMGKRLMIWTLAMVLLCGLCAPLLPQPVVKADAPLKTTISVEPGAMAEPGNVKITVTVRNTTNEIVESVLVKNSKAELSFGTIAAGASATEVIESYSVSQSELDSGVINFEVKCDGYAGAATATIKKKQYQPALKAELTIEGADKPVAEGTKLTYKCVVTNTGDVAIKNITATDAKIGSLGGGFTLEPGASKELSAQYTFSDTFNAQVNVTGTASVGGQQVSAQSGIVTVQKASGNLSVAVTPSATEVAAGEEVTIKGTLSNQGNVDITGVNGTDSFGNTAFSNVTVPAGQEVPFEYKFTMGEEGNYTLSVAGKGSDGRDYSASTQAQFSVKVTTDSVRVDMEVKADKTQLDEAGKVKLTFTFNNPRSVPMEMSMYVREVDGDKLFDLTKLAPGKSTQEREIEVKESGTKRYELIVKDAGGNELTAGAAAISFTVGAPEDEQPQEEEKKSNLGWLWTLLIIVGFLLVAGGVVFAVLMVQEKKAKQRGGKKSARGNAPFGTDARRGDAYGQDRDYNGALRREMDYDQDEFFDDDADDGYVDDGPQYMDDVYNDSEPVYRDDDFDNYEEEDLQDGPYIDELDMDTDDDFAAEQWEDAPPQQWEENPQDRYDQPPQRPRRPVRPVRRPDAPQGGPARGDTDDDPWPPQRKW
nr:hypothetical protein [Maliibacterium massiliense]